MAGRDAVRRLVEARVASVVRASGGVTAPQAGLDLGRAIGTHDGHFHCDEALATGLLQLTESYKGWPIVRTRNPTVLGGCKVVVDVGGVFDAAALRFDHHQRGFTETFSESKAVIKLSSAGLVYKHFGREIIETVAQGCGMQLEADMVERMFHKVYEGFIEHIDGIDNGQDAFSGDKIYNVSTHLSARVGSLNPAWNEEQSTEHEMRQFAEAVALTTLEFAEHVGGLLTVWLPARAVVERGVAGRMQVDASGAIVRVDTSCPWKSHLYQLEAEGKDGLAVGQVKYVLYEDSGGSWRVQCVPVDEASFQSRHPLPEKVRGVRDDALSALWGIPGCIFVHASGFIGGNKTYEGALEMARRSLVEGA